MGAGGVDDGEDAEVILHEYGHAVHDAQVPGWGDTHEGGAMGEGWGDFLAAVRKELGARDFTVKDLVQRMAWHQGRPPAEELVDALPAELAGDFHKLGAQAIARRLGMWLKNRNGRWAGDLVCEDRGRNSANVTRYRVRGYDDGEDGKRTR